MKKLTLEDLKLESFLTELDSSKLIQGGAGTTTDYTGDDTDPWSDRNCDTNDDCMPSANRECDTQANCPSLHVTDCGEEMQTYEGICDTDSREDCHDYSVYSACDDCGGGSIDTDGPGCGSASGNPCWGEHTKNPCV